MKNPRRNPPFLYVGIERLIQIILYQNHTENARYPSGFVDCDKSQQRIIRPLDISDRNRKNGESMHFTLKKIQLTVLPAHLTALKMHLTEILLTFAAISLYNVACNQLICRCAHY